MNMNKLFAALLCVVLLLCAAALAEGSIDADGDVSLAIILQDEGAALPGVQMDIYRVAAVDGDGKWKKVAPFDQYHVELDGGSESELAGIASTLEGYVLRDQIAPTESGTTNPNGKAVFPADGGSLKQGLYLVMGQRCAFEGKVYTIQPSVVQLPLWDAAGERWIYDVEIRAKYDVQPDVPELPPIARKVLKVWNDDGHEVSRPDEVVVQLLRDGEVFDTVALNADNLWRHAWEQLDAEYQWTVVEQPMEGYSVVVIQEGITFVVTNTYDPENPPPTPAPTPEPDAPPDQPSPPSKLPQTGQLWWPVAMLVFVGLLLIVIGLARRRGN